MRGRKAWVVVVLLVGLPTTAFANRVTDVSFSVRDGDAVVTVTAEDPLSDPRVRSERAGLRVWFPGVDEDVRWDLKGDGKEIGEIRLRPGGSQTGLLSVALLQGRTLPRGTVRAEAQGRRFFLRIAGEALPELEQGLVPGEEVPVAGAATGNALAEASGPGSRELEIVEEPSGEAAGPGSASAEGMAPLGTAEPGAGLSTEVYVVLLLSVAALAGYGFLRKLKLKLPRADAWSNIQVLGSRRLGVRHQLILVRALGEDHLLMVNGDRTERIASLPSQEHHSLLQEHAMTPHDELDDEPESGLEPELEAKRSSLPLGLGKDILNLVQRRGEERREMDSRPPEEAFRESRARELRPREPRREVRTQAGGMEASPAVQGLLRLRREVR